MLNAELLVEHLPNEIAQRREEGHDVSSFERRWADLKMPAIEIHRPIPEGSREAVERAESAGCLPTTAYSPMRQSSPRNVPG